MSITLFIFSAFYSFKNFNNSVIIYSYLILKRAVLYFILKRKNTHNFSRESFSLLKLSVLAKEKKGIYNE